MAEARRKPFSGILPRFCRILPLGLVLAAFPAYARDVGVAVCFNYGCQTQREIRIDEVHLDAMTRALKGANSAEGERRRLARVIGALYALASEQTPIGSDRGGNDADDSAWGRMDCIDHSTTTTRFLKLLEARGDLRWHRVLEPARRLRFWVAQHFSAVIEALPEAALPDRAETDRPSDAPDRRYAVDSWFVDNGKPAVILPLEDWLEGKDPVSNTSPEADATQAL